jgi:acetylornithine deacetylase/succinyl-diaminopimelate desuccinylase-like protein
MHSTIRASLVVLSTLLTLPLGAQSRTAIYTPGKLTPNQQVAHDIYKELIEINTGMKTGNVTPAANAMAKRFRDAGLPDSDIFVGGPKPDKFNVVARIHGNGASGRKPLLLLAHIDVVEALKADWSADLDPFVFTERDGYYYGRGTADDKAMASIFVANATRMVREHVVPDRDVIVALTADEEGGGSNGVDWLLKNHPALVNAAYAINEGGGGTLRNGRPLFNSVATEKVTTNITLRATNRGGHSSVPRADNAIVALADAIAKVGRHQFPVRFNDVTRAFFAKTADVEDPAIGRAMKALVANPTDAAALSTVAADPRYNSMLRTTCVPTMLSGGHATNALPQLAEATINCRMFPTDTPAVIRADIERLVNDTTVQVVMQGAARPPAAPSPLLPELFDAITQVTHDMWGSVPVIPVMSTGATDSRFFRALGTPAFGVSGLFSDPTVDARAHGRDERMRIQSYYEGQEFLWRLTRTLTSAPKTAVP